MININNSNLINLGFNPSVNSSLSHGITPASYPGLPSGISPHPTLHPSAIYGVGETLREDRALPTWKKGNSLILHKLEIVAHLDTIDIDLIEKSTRSLYEKVERKETTGKIYTCIVYKEQEGESISIYKYNTGKVKVHFITHKTTRLLKYKNILKYIGVEKVHKFYAEVYVRYHEKDERKVEEILEALLRQYGKRRRKEEHMKSGKKLLYLDRVMDIEYRGLKCSIKSYRHKHYSRYPRDNPEYHPKLELTIVKENVTLSEITLETIKTGAVLLYTIVETLKLRLIYGEYERQQETIEIYGIDPEISRVLRGVKKRVKAIYILEREYHDIRLAVAELLVEKKLKAAHIARLLGYSERWIKKIVEELVESEVISRVSKGKYTWANKTAKLEKPLTIRHHYVRSLQELADKIREIKTQHKLISVEYNGNIVINYETETERVRLITNTIANHDYAEIINPITRKRHIIDISRHNLAKWITRSAENN